MKVSKLTLAVLIALSASASYDTFAIDVYVDTKTKQIYAEPGPHRERLGSFVRVEDASVEGRPTTVNPATAVTTRELTAVREELETKSVEIKAL